MPPAPAKPAHTPTALARPSGGKTLVIVDNVPGMISAAPTPVRTRHAMSVLGGVAQRRGGAGDAEDGDAGDERAAAAEPVADRAGREEECGQRDRVAVDDPLLVARRRAERGGEGRDRDGHHRHAGHDQHEGQQHRDEHGGAPAGARSAPARAPAGRGSGFGTSGPPGSRGSGRNGNHCFRNCSFQNDELQYGSQEFR